MITDRSTLPTSTINKAFIGLVNNANSDPISHTPFFLLFLSIFGAFFCLVSRFNKFVWCRLKYPRTEAFPDFQESSKLIDMQRCTNDIITNTIHMQHK